MTSLEAAPEPPEAAEDEGAELEEPPEVREASLVGLLLATELTVPVMLPPVTTPVEEPVPVARDLANKKCYQPCAIEQQKGETYAVAPVGMAVVSRVIPMVLQVL